MIFTEDDFRKPTLISEDGRPVPLGFVYCVGRNYAEHVAEMGNRRPDQPLVFFKPTGAVCQECGGFQIPEYSRNVHHEVELVIVIGKAGRRIAEGEAQAHIAGSAVGLDMTLRDVQSREVQAGAPWSVSKGFDGSCPLSRISWLSDLGRLTRYSFFLEKNGRLVQRGDTSQMIYPIPYLVSYISQYFTFQPGDLLMTGTPAGVGPVSRGDVLRFGGESIEPVTVDVQ